VGFFQKTNSLHVWPVRGGQVEDAMVKTAVGASLAGSLDSLAGPTDPASAMPSIEGLYDRLVGGAGYAPRSTFVEPEAGPGPTGHTLQQLLDAAPVVDNADGAALAEVLAGKTYWGLRTGGWGLQTGWAGGGGTPAPVGRTGQVTCSDEVGTVIACVGTGQDGDLRPGVAWPALRFADNGDGTVTDNLTGLVWLRDASCFGARTWVNALADANGLASGSCGLADGSVAGDWRLPSRFELESLVDLEYVNPPLSNAAGNGKWMEGDAFFGVRSDPYSYWSSTSVAYFTSYQAAWVLHGFGKLQLAGKSTCTSCCVWPVRGGQ
jgi:hypothetical protein